MKTNRIALAAKFSTVRIPHHGQFHSQSLIEAVAGELTSGFCATVEEAQTRIEQLINGEPTKTSMPDGQASVKEMNQARLNVASVGIRDGGACAGAIEEAHKAGPHTVEWAIASRYIGHHQLWRSDWR